MPNQDFNLLFPSVPPLSPFFAPSPPLNNPSVSFQPPIATPSLPPSPSPVKTPFLTPLEPLYFPSYFSILNLILPSVFNCTLYFGMKMGNGKEKVFLGGGEERVKGVGIQQYHL